MMGRYLTATTRRGLVVYLAVLLVFLFAPILISVLYSFSARRFPGFPVTEFSLQWYLMAWNDEALRAAFRRSITVSAVVSVVATVIGFFGAYTDYRFRFFGKHVYLVLGLLPPTIPLVILGLALLVFLSRFHLNGSLQGVMISHIVFCTPFAMALIRLRLAQMDPHLEPAAWNLGANAYAAVWFVAVRFCTPALIASVLVTFAISLDEFTIAWFVSGTEQTLPIRVLNIVERQASPVVNVVGTVTFATTMTLIGIALVLLSRRKN
jgi:spermidine/putrescine transport system permease protein